MLKKTIPLILHPHFTKIASLLIGYMFWFFISQYHWTTIQHVVPLCFYHSTEQIITKNIQAPDTIMIIATGPRKDIYHYSLTDNPIHIDIAPYQKNGTYEIQLSKENLFLPDALKLVQLIPNHIVITISSNTQANES